MAAAAAAAYTYLPVSTYCSYFPPARARCTHSIKSIHPLNSIVPAPANSIAYSLLSLHPVSLTLSHFTRSIIILSSYSSLFVVSFPGLSLSCPHIPNSYVHYYYQYFPHFPFICSNYLRISLLLRLNSFYLPSLTFFFFFTS